MKANMLEEEFENRLIKAQEEEIDEFVSVFFTFLLYYIILYIN